MNEYLMELLLQMEKELSDEEIMYVTANGKLHTNRKKDFKRRYWNMEKKAITIFTAKTARELLKDGFTLIDTKPDKNDPDGKRSVFIFRNDENLLEKIKEYKEK